MIFRGPFQLQPLCDSVFCDILDCLRTANFSLVGRGHAQGSMFIKMGALNIEDFYIFLNNYDRVVLRAGKMETLKNTQIINAITIHSAQCGLDSVTSIALTYVVLHSAFF